MINFPERERQAVEELLRSGGTNEFNYLRRLHFFWRPDLAAASLQGLNLEGVNLREANLSGVFLNGAKLWNVDFRWARLVHANLSGADVTGADLKGADLTEADLTDTAGMLLTKNLEGCILQKAKVTPGILTGFYRRLKESCRDR